MQCAWAEIMALTLSEAQNFVMMGPERDLPEEQTLRHDGACIAQKGRAARFRHGSDCSWQMLCEVGRCCGPEAQRSLCLPKANWSRSS